MCALPAVVSGDTVPTSGVFHFLFDEKKLFGDKLCAVIHFFLDGRRIFLVPREKVLRSVLGEDGRVIVALVTVEPWAHGMKSRSAEELILSWALKWL